MNRADPVSVPFTIEMKLQRVIVVFVFGALELTEIVSSLCLVRNTRTPKVYWYQCFKSNDYLADVKKAPIDVPRLTFINSKIKIVQNGSFTRLNKYLERIAFFNCDVEEIEDHAFRGLAKLDLLGFAGNKLRVIKSVWFEGLSNLKTISFQNNKIKHVEDSFFSILPPLESLDISMNEITCLNVSLLGNLKTDEFNFRDNPLTWMCQTRLINWVKEKRIPYDHIDFDYMDTGYQLGKMCIEKTPSSQVNEEVINKCVQETTREFLPANKNYTVKDVCKFMKDNNKQSPFLVCAEQKSVNIQMG